MGGGGYLEQNAENFILTYVETIARKIYHLFSLHSIRQLSATDWKEGNEEGTAEGQCRYVETLNGLRSPDC